MLPKLTSLSLEKSPNENVLLSNNIVKLLNAQQMAYLHINREWTIIDSEFFAIIDMTFPLSVLTSTLHARNSDEKCSLV